LFNFHIRQTDFNIGDSLHQKQTNGLENITTRLQWWFEKRFNGKFINLGPTLPAGRQKDYCSCGLFAINTIEHRVFEYPLDVPNPSFERARWFFLTAKDQIQDPNEDAQRLEKESLEKESLEKERLEKERLEKERLEKERLEKESLEKERLEKERLEKESLEKERLEKERLEKERLEKERLEKESLEKERLEKERLEKESLEKERLEKERLEKERLEKERLEKERLEQVPGSEDNTIRVWDMETGKELGNPLHGKTSCVNPVAISQVENEGPECEKAEQDKDIVMDDDNRMNIVPPMSQFILPQSQNMEVESGEIVSHSHLASIHKGKGRAVYHRDRSSDFYRTEDSHHSTSPRHKSSYYRGSHFHRPVSPPLRPLSYRDSHFCRPVSPPHFRRPVSPPLRPLSYRDHPSSQRNRDISPCRGRSRSPVYSTRHIRSRSPVRARVEYQYSTHYQNPSRQGTHCCKLVSIEFHVIYD
jgi:hypothetical protein